MRPGSVARTLSRPAVFAPLIVVLSLVSASTLIEHRPPAADEGAVLTQAVKVLRGGVFYRDIDAYPLPGAIYPAALAMRLFGEHLSVGRWLGSVVSCGILLGVYAIALPLLGRRRSAVLVFGVLSFKFFAWPSLTAYVYWDVAFALACFAIALYLRWESHARLATLAAAGACAGASLAAKQSVGLYLLGTLTLLVLCGTQRTGSVRTRVRSALALGLGALAPLLPMLAHFAAHGVLGAMFYGAFIRPFVGYLPLSGISFWVPLRWWEFGSLRSASAFPYFPDTYWRMLHYERLPGEALQLAAWLLGEFLVRCVYTSIPLAAVGLGLLAWRTRGVRQPNDARLVRFGVLAFAVVLSAFPRADYTHVISIYPLVLILLYALWTRLLERWPTPGPARWSAPAELFAATLAVLVGAGVIWVNTQHLTYHVSLERGEFYVEPREAWIEPLVRYVRKRVPAGAPMLVVGQEAHYYFLSDRYYDDWPFVQLYPGQVGGEGGRELVRRLTADPPSLVVRGVVRFPGIPKLEDYAPELVRYLVREFAVDPAAFRRARDGVEPPSLRLCVVLRPRKGR